MPVLLEIGYLEDLDRLTPFCRLISIIPMVIVLPCSLWSRVGPSLSKPANRLRGPAGNCHRALPGGGAGDRVRQRPSR